MSAFRKTALLLSTILITSLMAACFGGPVEGVRVAEVTRGDESELVTAVGVLDAAQPVDVTPVVGGTIVALPAKEGDYVKAGDVLATLNEQELAQQSAQARADYYTSQSIGDIIGGQYDNMSMLYENMRYFGQAFQYMQGQVDSMVISFYDMMPVLLPYLPPEQQAYLESVLQEQRENYLEAIVSRPVPPGFNPSGYPASASAADAARTEAAGYDYQRVMQGTQSPYIIAPVSGYVVYVSQQAVMPTDVLNQMLGLDSLTTSMGSLSSLLGGDVSGLLGGGGQAQDIEVGSKLNAGQTAFQIVDLQSMKVRAQVEETDIPGVVVGQAVEIYLDAYPDMTFNGEVVQVGIKSETGSAGTTVFPVVIQMDRVEVPLRLGYNATVDVTVISRTDIISLPITALLEEDGVDYVYVVEDGKARRRQITMGEKTREWLEVISGLDDGERVVVEGVGKVEEGRKVE